MIPEAEAAGGQWRDVTNELTALAARMPSDRWDAPSSCGAWSNRELLSHLATGYVVRIEWFESALAGRAAIVPPDIDAVNERNVAAWRPAPIEAIVAEMLATRDRILQLLEQLEAQHLEVEFDRDGRPVRLGDILATLSSHDRE
ncbi:MAG: hypothetical protein EPO22_13255, partial [Dehalococcoidia bacterium]